MFELFWEKTTSRGKNLKLSEPSLRRRRRVPQRLDEGNPRANIQELLNITLNISIIKLLI